MASSSSSSSPPMKYQVFLSFRGEDTRHNFTSHLRKALKVTGMSFFFDEDKLERGEHISPALSRAITASRLSIVVLSSDYASSKSCLAELSYIMNRRGDHGHIVLPIFYHVDPSDVRNLGGSFKTSFDYHESESVHQVQRWKDAFAEVGKLKGWHIEGGKFDRTDDEYIEAIVEYVLTKLNSESRSVSENLVGIDEQKKVILGLIEKEESRVIGIWGMAGIGKTTLAGAVYDEIRQEFRNHCFLQNVREEVNKKGMNSVRNKLLSKLLNSEIEIDTPRIVSDVIQDRLKNMKLIVVLDDVDELDQIDLMGVKHFGDGNKIIVTSRDRQVLNNGGAKPIHEVKKLNEDDSLQLFSTFAFKQLHPADDFRQLSYKFVHYADGNPLTIRNLGCKLYGKPRGEWESELNKLERYAEPKNSQIPQRSSGGTLGAINLKRINYSRDRNLFELPPIDDLASLVSIHLHGCMNLRKIPDLSGAVNLEAINFSECTSLSEIPGLNDLVSLQSLHLIGCKNLKEIPDLSGAINLKWINFSQCTSLTVFPRLNDLACLESLHLSGCENLMEIPGLSRTDNLKVIDFCGCRSLVKLPYLNDLTSLEMFLLNGCKNLRKIHDLSGAINLRTLDCSGCTSLVELPCVNDLPSLETFQI